jgi:hypothetical protein
MLATITAIFGAIKEFFGSFKYFDKWFTKTPTEKVQKELDKIDDQEEEFKKTGRPEWK